MYHYMLLTNDISAPIIPGMKPYHVITWFLGCGCTGMAIGYFNELDFLRAIPMLIVGLTALYIGRGYFFPKV